MLHEALITSESNRLSVETCTLYTEALPTLLQRSVAFAGMSVAPFWGEERLGEEGGRSTVVSPTVGTITSG